MPNKHPWEKKNKKGKQEANKSLASQGFSPYLGTVRPVRQPKKPTVLGPEPGSGLSLPQPEGTGVITHLDGCGAHTLVRQPKNDGPFSYTCFGCNLLVSGARVKTLSPSEFRLFGDESVSGNLTLYGLLLLNESLVDEAAQELCALLDDVTGHPGTRFHCKEVFHPHPRAKTPWANVDDQTIQWTAVNIAKLVKSKLPAFHIGLADKTLWPKTVPGTSVTLTAEHLYPVAFMAAVCTVQECGLLSNNCQLRLEIDRIEQKLHFAGLGKAKIERLFNVQHLEIEPRRERKSLLLDAVDLFTYAYGRQRTGRSTDYFDQIVEIIRPSVAEANWEPNNPRRPYEIPVKDGVPVLWTASSSAIPTDPT